MDKFRYSPIGSETSDQSQRPTGKHDRLILRLSILANILLTTLLLVISVFLLLGYQPSAKPCSPNADSNVDPEMYRMMQEHSTVSSKEIKTYKYFEDGFDDEDFAKGDPFWADLFPRGGGIVYLTDEVKTTLRLPPTVRDPWRGNQSTYMMAGWHSLHCLTSLRQVLGHYMQAQRTRTRYEVDEEHWDHVKHCLADARQQLLCHFDETLFPAHDFRRHPGPGEPMLCKPLEPIQQWVKDHWMVGVAPKGFDFDKWEAEHPNEAKVPYKHWDNHVL